MLKKIFSLKHAEVLFRSAVAMVFAYFGVQASLQPEWQAALWLQPFTVKLIAAVLPVKVFMIIFGGLQTVVALLLLAGRFLAYVLPAAAVLLLGIIVNVGFNEVSLRDFVILTGVLFLYSRHLASKQAGNKINN
ncbi:MAG: hypothetical protein UV78_C0065G0006 [Parcubacteria group bacterium GW2011_GWA2_43_17]|nr:MAG: hypothetical protein UV78_C0065G0006 [Parcubacteria group bacterium GW2011_GWA2_43_17]HAH04223.1 hypothetical protein [Candidatus Komeilibacteria bacterium]HBV01945.1 hypothetical protein [Candidatus Komeilibacteria bacterium]HCC74091.1 hypothetical protein [Candidatus Komeilibacteria bacterium]